MSVERPVTSVGGERGGDRAVAPRDARRVGATAKLVHTLFGGIFAWLVHLIALAGLNGYVCASGQLWPMHVATVVTLVLALHAGWTGWRIAHDPEGSAGTPSASLLGWVGVVLNGFNAGLIVVEWIPVLVIAPCVSA